MTTLEPRTARSTAGTAQQQRHLGRGLGWAVLSAASFGLSGPLAKSLLEIGWTPGAVVLVRVAGAFALLLVPCLVLLRGMARPSAAAVRRMLTYGVVAVALAQLCYFNAVSHLSVGVALLLEYLAPVLLIGWHWWRSKKRPARSVFLGAAIAMGGMVLVLDVARGVTLNPVGVLWGLAAAACLCVFFVLSDDSGSGESIPPMLMTTVGTGVGAAVLVAAGAVGFVPMAFASGRTSLAGLAVAWWVPIALLIVVTAAVAYLMGIAAIRHLGSGIASFVALSEVLFAVVFAALLLGQLPTVAQAVGGI
ncbi:MAG TPA: EamA family transporter, partial [Propionibacteriaceae bacterium]